jgi:hypothetical protein
MKNLPKIVIKENLRQEVNVFLNFLHHPYYPQHRNLIFRVFPELKLLLKNKKDEKKIVRKFIIDFRENHKDKINQIIKQSKVVIKNKGPLALKALANLMDYDWTKPTTYTAIPTILPHSPFGDNVFYFSILKQINKGKSDRDVLYIAIHEISHFIFLIILKKLKRKISLNFQKMQ